MSLSDWQSAFFAARVQTPASGREGVYFREQVFGALEVLRDALPDLEAVLGEQGFRFFVRELLAEVQPRDAMGTSLIEPFLELLLHRPELSQDDPVLDLVRAALETIRADSASP